MIISLDFLNLIGFDKVFIAFSYKIMSEIDCWHENKTAEQWYELAMQYGEELDIYKPLFYR